MTYGTPAEFSMHMTLLQVSVLIPRRVVTGIHDVDKKWGWLVSKLEGTPQLPQK